MVNHPRRLDFSDVSLYAITSAVKEDGRVVNTSEQLLKGGVDVLQLRSRELTDLHFIRLGKKLRDLCHDYNALFIVNNRPDLALEIGADGVHLGHEDGPIHLARQILGHHKIIGASTHSVPQALDAQRKGADYVSCGPIWATPTKPNYEPVGLNLIGFYRAALKIPYVVIGGVNESNIDEVVKAGARCVAVVRALFDAGDPYKQATFFKEKLQSPLVLEKEIL